MLKYIRVGNIRVYLDRKMTYVHDTGLEMVKLKMIGENRAGDPVYEDEHLVSKRSWAPIISVMQMEDSEGYGYPLKAIGRYTSLGSTTSPMMLWSLLGAIMGCGDLWRAIDSKEGPFREDGWEGHVLTHLQFAYLKHEEIHTPAGTPFKKRGNTSTIMMLKRIAPFLPNDLRPLGDGTRLTRRRFHKFGLSYWESLFPRVTFPSVLVGDSTGDLLFEEGYADTLC